MPKLPPPPSSKPPAATPPTSAPKSQPTPESAGVVDAAAPDTQNSDSVATPTNRERPQTPRKDSKAANSKAANSKAANSKAANSKAARRRKRSAPKKPTGVDLSPRWMILGALLLAAAAAAAFMLIRDSEPTPFDFGEGVSGSAEVQRRLMRIGELVVGNEQVGEAVRSGRDYMVVTRLSEQELDLLEEGESGSWLRASGPSDDRAFGVFLRGDDVLVSRVTGDGECLMLAASPGGEMRFATEGPAPCDPTLSTVSWSSP